MSLDPLDWLPPDMDPVDGQALLDSYPGDPHRAAAEAWEGHAAALEVGAGDNLASVSTGSQTASYGPYGSGARGAALQRAAWHRARSRAQTTNLGPTYTRTAGTTPGVPVPLTRTTMRDDSNDERFWKAAP